MSRKKLTLSVKEELTKRAKAIAEERGTSVSRLVETFFSTLETRESVDSVEAASLPDPEDQSDSPSPLEDYEPSSWAQRWRGAFAENGKTYPDTSDWEEEVLTKAIKEKHS